MEIKRGQIYWLLVDSTDDCIEKKTRPYLVVSSDKVCSHGEVIQVIPITSRLYDYKTYHVPVIVAGKRALVLCEHIYSVSRDFFVDKELDELNENQMALVNFAVLNQLGLETSEMYVMRQMLGTMSLCVDRPREKVKSIVTKVVHKKSVVAEEKKTPVIVDPKKGVIRNVGKYNWSQKKIDDFRLDASMLSVTECMEKYSLKSRNQYYYVLTKFGGKVR